MVAAVCSLAGGANILSQLQLAVWAILFTFSNEFDNKVLSLPLHLKCFVKRAASLSVLSALQTCADQCRTCCCTHIACVLMYFSLPRPYPIQMRMVVVLSDHTRMGMVMPKSPNMD